MVRLALAFSMPAGRLCPTALVYPVSTICVSPSEQLIALWAIRRICVPIDRIAIPINKIGSPIDKIGNAIDRIGNPIDRNAVPIDRIDNPIDRIGVPAGVSAQEAKVNHEVR